MMDPSFVFAPLFVIITAFSGIGNEALDYVDTGTYWKLAEVEANETNLIAFARGQIGNRPDDDTLKALFADLNSSDFATRQKAVIALAKIGADARPQLELAAGSDDPEVAVAAARALSQLREGAGGNRLHRLMAIRTLGEIEAKAAIPHLEKLKASKEAFVAEYARRALAEIRGEAMALTGPDPNTLQKDLAITHPSIAAVFHARSGPRRGPVRMWNQVKETDAIHSLILAFNDPETKRPDPESLLASITAEHLAVFQQIGNVRIDSFSVTIPEDYTPSDGGIVVITRGLCDYAPSREFLIQRLSDLPGAGRRAPATFQVEGFEWIKQNLDGADFFVHFPPSGDLLIFVGGIRGMKYVESVSRRMAGKDKSPARGPALKRLKEVPESATAVIAGSIPKQDFIDHSFKSMTGWMTKKEDGSRFIRMALGGGDAQRISDLKMQYRVLGGAFEFGLKPLVRKEPLLSNILKTYESIRVSGEAGTLLGEVTIPAQGGLPLGVWVGFESVHRRLGDREPWELPEEDPDLDPDL